MCAIWDYIFIKFLKKTKIKKHSYIKFLNLLTYKEINFFSDIFWHFTKRTVSNFIANGNNYSSESYMTTKTAFLFPILFCSITFVINNNYNIDFLDTVDCTFGSFGYRTEGRLGTRRTVHQKISSVVLSNCWKYISNVCINNFIYHFLICA